MSFDRIAGHVAHALGRPWAIVVAAIVCAAAWWLLDTDHFNLAISLFTLAMLFVLQNATNRGDLATHAKLDEIVHALDKARDEVAGLDDASEEEIQALRADCGAKTPAEIWHRGFWPWPPFR